MHFIWFCILVDDRWAPMLVKEGAARGRFLVSGGSGGDGGGLVWSGRWWRRGRRG